MHTKPFSEARAKGQCWVNPSVGVVDVISRNGEGNRHFGKGLENGPDTAANHEVGNYHVAWATSCERLAGSDEDTAANI